MAPPNMSDDNHIREGLGSLNRWSQSTASSNFSPKHVGHRRQDSVTRGFAMDNHGSHKRALSIDTNSQVHFPTQAITVPDNGDQLANHSTRKPSITLRHMETAMLDPPGLGALPKSSTDMTVSTSSQSDASAFDHMSGLVDPRTQGYSPEMEPFRQTGAGHSAHMSGRAHAQKEKRRQGQSQKAMLSKALQKANTAVLLDNAANFEGAMDAYNDACQLLQLVMLRSNGGEDEKLKLQEIRDTYMIRVTELQRMDFSFRNVDSKALPERPLSQESYGEYLHPTQEDNNYEFSSEDPAILRRSSLGMRQVISEESRKLSQPQIPPRRQSLLPSAIDDGLHGPAFSSSTPKHQADYSESEFSEQVSGHRRENSGAASASSDNPMLEENPHYDSRFSELSMLSTQAREVYESTSWLDTIDESGASSSASVHSRTSSIYLRRRRNSRLSHGTEAEFDAALDAAVEAAYGEGLEPVSDSDEHDEYDGHDDSDDVLANARRNVEIAKQKVREAEREAEVAMTRGRELRRIQEQETIATSNDPELDYLDEEAEEEERLLEEMTRGYVMDDFEFDLQSKSALPRQSSSNSLYGKMREGSVSFSPMTTGGTLSTLVEDDVFPDDPSTVPQDPPGIPPISTQPASMSTAGPGVRARRMSGQNTTELKIETGGSMKSGVDNADGSQSPDTPMHRPSTPVEKDGPPTSIPLHSNKGSGVVSSTTAPTAHQHKRNVSIGSIIEDIPPNLKLAREITAVDDEGDDDDTAGASKMLSLPRPIGKVPSAPDNLGRPNPSATPLRGRNVSVPNPELHTEPPGTPSSSAFPTLDIQKGIATASGYALPTPTAANYAPSGLPSDGLYLFDSYIHSPTSPGSPNSLSPNSPLPLEPCPESFLLRPFWLMRCIYQTVAHPRGGYLSTKLFIPRDVWRVKNVKLKAVEEKVSNCDLLTAALLKLSKVDMYDADAVLEEMQAFESVLDQVQMSLSKKLGSEVGVQGALPLFKTAQALDDTTTIDSLPPRASGGQSKSYLSSWRKLRSKNSGFGTGSLSSSKEASKDHLTISSLPMTSTPNPQSSKRNIAQVQFNGPNANYMSALARLCDAAQVLDQIAQQVEDPGLRNSSQTLVGLELSTRHAAEFFGFYICRFALNDIGLLLDKFIKRGSEWVLL